MRTRHFFRTTIAALVVAAAGVIASAQTVQITGKVTLKQADGTEAPVEGAKIDIFRTDIKQEFHLKSNKKGEYLHAGIPFGGTFTLAVCAPGARPTFSSGLRLSQQPNNNFVLQPGDGTCLTLDQIKAAGATSAAPSGGTAASAESADAKKAREEFEKEKARVEEANAKIAASNEIVKKEFEAGNAAFTAKNYDEAIAAYDRALAAQPEQAVLHLNRSIALRIRAVDSYNAGLKAKDNAKREAAKADFRSAAEAADKAVKFYREQSSKSAGPAAPANNNDMINYLSARMEGYRLALQTMSNVPPEQAVTAIQEYISAETDPAKKAKAEASLGEALFQSGRVDEAIASYRQVLAGNAGNLDAMYGLGLALAAKVQDAEKDTATIKEAREMLQQFIDKAPDTHPRKAEAVASVQYLDETMKGASASKSADKSGSSNRGGSKRKP
jgi:tetratricopeptide (TPR) repeat protein